MKTHPIAKTSYCFLLCLQALSHGAEIPKLFNNNALNTGGAWSGGVAPGTGDVMLWDSTFVDTLSSVAALSPLGGDMSVQGIKVTNVGGTRNVAARYVGFQNPLSANTLTIGSAGIDMSAATQVLLLHSKIQIGANQSWVIADANTQANGAGFNNSEDLAFSSLAAGTAFNFGGNTVTTSGNGFVTISSGFTLSNGTLNSGNNLFVIQGGGSRVTTLNSDLNLIVSSGRLRIGAQSGVAGVSLVSNSPLTVNGGAFEIWNNNVNSVTQAGAVTLNNGSGYTQILNSSGPNVTSGAVSVNGAVTWNVIGSGTQANGGQVTGNISGSGNINYLNTGTGTGAYANFSGDNSGYTGTIALAGASGNRSLRLSSATAGSAAATWNIGTGNSLQVNGVGVQLGTLLGSGTVTNPSLTTGATVTIGQGLFTGNIDNGLDPDATVALTKTGPGLLQLTGLNNYTGLTTVSGGTLVLTPDHTGAGAVTVADGATFGVLQKAADTTLTLGDLTVGAATGGTLQIDFGSQVNPTFAPLAAGNLLFNGDSVIRVSGKNLSTGTFPVVQYTTLVGGSTPVNDLELDLPTRTNGSLADDGFGNISLTITDTQQIKWTGSVDDNWDIDPDGSGGSGTANWLTTVTNATTRYIQGTGGTDVVTFDDSATGSGTVNLTTTLAPLALTVNNSTKDYTFGGSGKISGLTALEKTGTGTLTLANPTPYDHVGGTIVSAGTLVLGDGATAGAGIIPAEIANEGTVVLNRPDDHNYAYSITGNGALVKAQGNTLTFPTAITLNQPVALNAGTARFTAGGFLNGVLSGSGLIDSTGGTLEIGGLDPNTHDGDITVSAGQLRLNKPAGTQAVGGDITLTGTATLAIIGSEQIADTATINVFSNSADSLPGTPGTETFANANVNGPTPATQMILRSNASVTGLATVTQGILGVASSNNASVNAIAITSPTGMVRIAGSGGPSTLTVGSGGITASGGEIQVKFNTNDQNGVLKLNGDLTTTGNLAITNAGYAGASLNVIELNGSRTFNIGDGTTTTVAPDLGDYDNSPDPATPGSLVKDGAGTLVLNTSCNAAHSGGTTVEAGTLQVNGPHASTIQVNASGTLAGSGTLAAAATVAGTVAPGAAVGQLNSSSTVTLGANSGLDIEVGNWAGAVPGTDWDHLSVDLLALTASSGTPLTVRVLGTPAGFTETDKTLVIATSVQPISGFDVEAIQIDASGFSGGGTWEVQSTGTTIELVYTASAGTAYDLWAGAAGLDETNNGKTDDPDFDGQDNLTEFALNGSPLSGAASGKVVGKIATVGGQQALTLTLPVRDGAEFSGSEEQIATVDGVVYRIQAGNDLASWTLAVAEVTGGDATAIQSGLPELDAGWSYRTFRSPGAVADDAKEFLRAVVEEEILIAF
jgi:autotransporter-associated beta strand protein